MPYKNPEQRLAWQRANKDKCNQYKEKWLQSEAGIAYIAKQKDKAEIQKRINAERKAHEKILRSIDAREKRAAKDKAYRKRQRDKAINILGGVCMVCGMDDHDVLEFDHIEPLLRRTIGHKVRDVYKEVIKHKDPTQDFQLLCANCHTKKTRMNNEYGYAPR